MSFNLIKHLKGILISEDGTLTPNEIQVQPGGSGGHKTTLVSSQTADRTVTLPDASDTLVGKATYDALTNKTLVVSSNTVTTAASGNLTSTELNSALAELQTDVDSRATSAALVSHTGASSGVHGVTGSVVGTSDAQVLTNKTIDTANNTISNIANGNVSASAAIAHSKMAALTASKALTSDASGIVSASSVTSTELGYVSGVTSAIQSQLSGKALASDLTNHTGASSGVHGVTGSVVGTSDAQTLSAKTFGDAITATQIATPSNPASGYNKIYAKSDNKFYSLSSAGVESVVGGGLSPWATSIPYAVGDVVTYSKQAYICLTAHTSSSTMEADILGGKWQLLNLPQVNRNYALVGNNFEDNDVGGWQLFNISGYSAGSMPASAPTLGSASSLSINTTATSPLSGKYSLIIGNTASTNITAGHGIISQAFGIDRLDQAKVLSTKFAYEVANGAASMSFAGTSSNTFGIFIYDVDNSQWIQPAGVYSMAQSSGVGKTPDCSWQAPANMTQFKIAILCMNTTTASSPAVNTLQMKFDDFFTGPSNYVYGTPITDWQSYTLTIGAVTTPPTQGSGTIKTAFWRRAGDSMELMFTYAQTAAGSAGSGTYLFPLPSGYSIDTNKITVSTGAIGAGGTVLGFGQASNTASSGAASAVNLQAIAYNTTNLQLVDISSNTAIAISSTQFPLSNTVTYYSYFAKVPILGWSSSVQMSDSVDTRVCAMRANGTPASASSASIIVYPTVLQDTHAAYNSSTGQFTAPITGYYSVSAGIRLTTSPLTSMDVYVDGAVVQAMGHSSADSRGTVGSSTVYVNAGQKIDVRLSVGGTPASDIASWNYLNISRVTGPSAIAASETVAASYYASANTAAISQSAFNFDTKDFDTHNAVTTGASWKFTAPVGGVYDISAALQVTNPGWMGLYKNGTLYKTMSYIGAQSVVMGTIKLVAGDYIYVSCISTNTTVTGGASNVQTTAWVNIKRVGIF